MRIVNEKIEEPFCRAAKEARAIGLNKVKACALRRWPVTRAFSPEQTTRLTGGHDLYLSD